VRVFAELADDDLPNNCGGSRPAWPIVGKTVGVVDKSALPGCADCGKHAGQDALSEWSQA